MRAEQCQAVLSQLRQELAAADLVAGEPQAAFQQLLARACEVAPLMAGIVWLLNDQGQPQVLCEHQLQTLTPSGMFTIGPSHQQQLATVLREGQSACLPIQTGDPELPDFMIAAGPLRVTTHPIGILELLTTSSLSADSQADLLRFLEELCEIGSELLLPTPSAEENPLAFWEQFDQFSLHLQRSLDVEEVAAIAANDGLVLLGCDRLSVALRHGRKTVLRAISGQEKVDRRSNLVRAMTAVAEQAISTGKVVTYRGVVEELPPQLERPLSDFVLESRSRMVSLVPLRQSLRIGGAANDADPARRSPPPRIIGCLIVEQMTDSHPRSTVTRRADLVADHVAAALTNARTHSELFLLPLWRGLGRASAWLRGRRLGMAAAVALLAAAAVLALVLIPWDYRVEGDGKAMPTLQREVFAAWDGDVRSILVVSGQKVAAGDLLLVITSDDLNAEHVAARYAVHEKETLVATLASEWQTSQQQSDREQQIRLQGELSKGSVELTAARQKEKKLADRIANLSVLAPISGTVVTYQLRQNLLDRPVRRGEVLLEIMDETGPWRLELEVPEYRMGHLLRALERSENRTLPVDYVAATAVEQTFSATLQSIGSRSNISEEQGTVVEVFADIDADELPQRRIGAEVTAKINCGRKSLGYVLFGDVIEFLQRKLWF